MILKHSVLLRCMVYGIEVLVLFLLQETPGLMPEVANARPVLIAGAALTIALFESQGRAVAFGVVCGLLMDIGMGAGVIGLHAILLALICYTISFFSQDYLQVNWLTSILTTGAGMGLVVLLEWFFGYVVWGYTDPVYALLSHYLPRLIYTVLLSLPLYAANRLFAVRIRPLTMDA